MLTEERHNAILRILGEKSVVSVQELTRMLGASEATIRRDLIALGKQGRLKKVRGGAALAQTSYQARDDEVAVRLGKYAEEKWRIGRYAARLIQNDDFVYIDAGTTTYSMLRFLAESSAVFVTNGLMHARQLASSGCTVHLIGGEVKPATEAAVGSEAVAAIQRFNFTKGFFGVNGITIKNGYTTPDVTEALLKTEAIAHCKQRYMLADPSKFNQIAPITFASLFEGTIVTTKLEEKEEFAGETDIVEVDRE